MNYYISFALSFRKIFHFTSCFWKKVTRWFGNVRIRKDGAWQWQMFSTTVWSRTGCNEIRLQHCYNKRLLLLLKLAWLFCIWDSLATSDDQNITILLTDKLFILDLYWHVGDLSHTWHFRCLSCWYFLIIMLWGSIKTIPSIHTFGQLLIPHVKVRGFVVHSHFFKGNQWALIFVQTMMSFLLT